MPIILAAASDVTPVLTDDQERRIEIALPQRLPTNLPGVKCSAVEQR